MSSLRSVPTLLILLLSPYVVGSVGCESEAPRPPNGSDDPCDCTACEQAGGICTDGCYNGLGCESVGCYTPTAPRDGEFSCDGLVNCKTEEICVILRPYGDGCSEHYCDLPPTSCSRDLSCSCIEASGMYDEITSCTESADGITVAAAFSNPELGGGGGTQ